jgi:hypothetical protein
LLHHPGLESWPNRDAERKRYLYTFVGNLPNAEYAVHTQSANNVTKALLERVYFIKEGGEFVPPPEPTVDVKKVLAKFRAELLRRCGTVAPMSFTEFCETYRGRRRTRYEAAAQRAQHFPFDPREAKLNSFLKAERFRFDLKPDAVPRLIQPYPPEYNIRVGRFIKPLEHVIYGVINSIYGHTTVVKGLNAEQCAHAIVQAWDSFMEPIAYMFDCSRFDQHVREALLKWTHSIYCRCIPAIYHRELKEYLRATINKIGFVRTPGVTFRYKVNGMRASGEMDTALGNVLIVCAILHSGMPDVNRYRLIDNGDDFVIITEKRGGQDVTHLPAHFRSLGFTLRLEGHTDVVERIRFCQASPVNLGHTWRMVRPPETITKDLATTRNMHDSRLREAWLTAVGCCGRALTTGVPIHYSIFAQIPNYQVYAEGDIDVGSGFFQLAKGLHDEAIEVSETARLSYWRAFGIAPYQQIVLERESYVVLDRLFSGHKFQSVAWASYPSPP